MKPHLCFWRGYWYCGERFADDPYGAKFFLWACCAPTVKQVCDLWRRVGPVEQMGS